jgi:sugar phosphate isomerase/epimerase
MEIRMSTPRLALQLFTVRQDVDKDYPGTLKAIAEMGYPAVQMAWFAASEPPTAELKQWLDDLGLAVAGCHVLLEDLERRLDWEVERCLQLGTPDVVIPWLAPARRSGYHALADLINTMGARCKALGARLSYHNHEFEFEREDGEYPIDILLGNTDPDLVKFEPDVYWVRYAGVDPAAVIKKYAGRCPLIHLKDMTAGPTPTYAEIGEGIIDFNPIFAASEAGGAEWYIAEQDFCARPALESARISLQHLREWGKL